MLTLAGGGLGGELPFGGHSLVFLFTPGDTINESFRSTKKKHLIIKRNSWAQCTMILGDEKTIVGLDGTRIINITQKIRTFDGR